MSLGKPRYLLLILIPLLAFSIYSNILHAPLIFDDDMYILNNPLIRSLGNFLSVPWNRYLTFFTFALNYSAGGLNTFGYHFANVIIHILNSLLVYLLVSLTFKTPSMRAREAPLPIALAASFIFAAHPVQTQAVSYITQRFASLAALFYLLAVVLYVKSRLDEVGWSRAFYIGAFASAVLAQLSKEISFTLPVIIALYEFTFFKRGGRSLLKPALFFLTLPIVPLTIFGPSGGDPHDPASFIRSLQVSEIATLSVYEYFITELRVIVTYIRLLFIPAGQNLLYDYPHFYTIFTPAVILSLILLLAILASSFYLYRRSRKGASPLGLLASFGVFWFFITLSIESSVIPIKDVIYEHRLYLPSAGAIIASVSLLFLISEKVRLAGLKWLVIPAVIALSIAAYKRNEVWADKVSLWRDVVNKSPGLTMGYYSLGYALEEKGKITEAMGYNLKALSIDPECKEALYNLGNNYMSLGMLDEAIYNYEEALKISPDDADTHTNLGNALARSGRIDEAIGHYYAALKVNPESEYALRNLEIVLKMNRGQGL